MEPLKNNVDGKRFLGLNRNIFMLGITSFFNDLSNEMILASFPAFFASVLKTGAASLGLVEGVADGAANFLKIYSGNLSDRINRRRIFIFFGYTLSVIVRPFYMFAGAVAPVLGLRIIDRIGKGVREAPRDVIISVSAGKHETGGSFGYHRAMDNLGGILGPLAAYFILLKWPGNFNAIFIIAFLLGLVAIASIIFVKEVIYTGTQNGKRAFSFSEFWGFPRSFKIYILAIFILSVGSMPVAVLLLKTTSIGLVIASIPLFYMIYNVTNMAISYFAGKVADKVGTYKVIFFGYVVLMLSYILIGTSVSALTLGFAFAILGIFSACTDSNGRAFVAQNTTEDKRGTAYGVFNSVVGFGAIFSGVIGGILWQYFGPSTALIISAIVVVLGLGMLLASVHAKRTEVIV